MSNAQGVDISSFQPVYTITEIQDQDFIFIKATEGKDTVDPNFAANAANAKAAGKPHGFYHFLHPGDDLATQVALFVKTVKPYLTAGVMIIVDSELLSGVALRVGRSVKGLTVEDAAVAAADVDLMTKGFLDGAKAALGDAHPYMVYTMGEVGQHLNSTAAAYPNLWFAFPSISAPSAAVIAPWKRYRFWQWSWSGGVDKDAYDGSAASLDTFIKGFLPPPPVTYEFVRVHPIGWQSLNGFCRRHGLSIADVIMWTEAKLPAQPRFEDYVKVGKWTLFMPQGINLIIRKEVKS